MTNTENLYDRIAEQEGWGYSTCFGQFHRSVPKDGYNQIESCFPDAFCFRLIEKYRLNHYNVNYVDEDTGDVIWTEEHEIEWLSDSGWKSVVDKNLEKAVMLAALSISEGE